MEVIESVGPGGNFMMSSHTMTHMRSEYFQGNGVTDWKSREKWEQDGGLDARERARAISRSILVQEEKPYIPEDIDHAIRERFDILL